ncbi:hypothetical protein KC725_03905 [Candidatus Peregrinibacteria bacterium]|nr:hypothetical protein [Candidatus Peregrinibacteria bacterium]
MNRIRNLFDLSKERSAYITEDDKTLNVVYQVSSLHLNQNQKEQVSKVRNFDFSNFEGSITIIINGRDINLKISLKESDRKLIFEIFYIIAYLLGENLALSYHYKNFPMSVPRGYNFGGYQWNFVNVRKFVLEPIEYIERGLKLIEHSGTVFSQILIPMLQINNIDLLDVRFFGEFVLLEGLSRNKQKNTTIVDRNQDPSNFKKLGSILKGTIERLSRDTTISEIQKGQLERKLDLGIVNSRGGTKDKIYEFIDSLGDNFQNYKEDIDIWNKLRSSRIAHGFNSGLTPEDSKTMNKLHEFLSSIVYSEFHGRLLFDQ